MKCIFCLLRECTLEHINEGKPPSIAGAENAPENVDIDVTDATGDAVVTEPAAATDNDGVVELYLGVLGDDDNEVARALSPQGDLRCRKKGGKITSPPASNSSMPPSSSSSITSVHGPSSTGFSSGIITS
mmetsp:Transcript_10368/g.12628  ORF Transcript_10368/g.12628 Transcript_10368/m.12628 type:complete len:130 (-) Transcript_10368:962-1351(-)